jgi:hypothetical protein
LKRRSSHLSKALASFSLLFSSTIAKSTHCLS